ncbi:MAG: 2-hydroxyacyl-CoA dehydratase [Oscillospiraceae bacterium]|nr:2-hydroxyacyl-CoA dehydratase [Candidatus Limimonas coprohippi]
MKDLKHIHFYEDLLEQANNELVQQAKSEGGVAVGYTCFYVPEVLLNVGNAFSVRLRAPNTGSLDISQYYMSSFVCGYSRALVERAFEGGYNFLDMWAGTDTCQQMNRVVENVVEFRLIDNPNFTHGFLDAPMKITEHGNKHYEHMIQVEFLDKMKESFGVDISDEAIRKAVKEHNEMCKIFEAISELRKAENPVITPREFHILCLVSYACPTSLILPYLKETYADIKERKPDAKNPWRARFVVVGSELDDYTFSEIMESCNAYVVADRYCFGAIPGRKQIPLTTDRPALEQVCEFYLAENQCPRFMSKEKIEERHEIARKLYEEFSADGIIYEQAKFCDFWGYERMLENAKFLDDGDDIPVLQIDREYVIAGAGQLRTRIQAFVESVEIKKIQKAGGAE